MNGAAAPLPRDVFPQPRAAVAAETESFDAFFARNLRRAPLLVAVVLVFFLIRALGIRAGALMVIAAAAVLVPLSVLRPELALYALVVNFVNELDSYYGLQSYLPVSLPMVFDAAVAIGIVLQVVLPRRLPPLQYAQNTLLLLYVIWVSLSLAFSASYYPPGYLIQFRTGFLIRPIFYLFIVILIRKPDQLHRLLLVLIFSHVVLMVSATSDSLQKGLELYRVRGTLSATNYLSYVCVATLPILVSIAVYLRHRPSRFFMFGLSLWTIFISLLTLSRSGYYALGATLFFLAVRFARNPRMLLIALGFAAIFYTQTPEDLSQRLAAVHSLTETSRYGLSRIGLRMALDHPLFGVGAGAFLREFPNYDYEHLFPYKQKASHSLYFDIAASCGFPALFFYLGTFALTAGQAFGVERRYRRARDFQSFGYFLALGIEAGLVGHFVFGLAGSYEDSYYAYLLLALSVLLVRHHQENASPLR